MTMTMILGKILAKVYMEIWCVQNDLRSWKSGYNKQETEIITI